MKEKKDMDEGNSLVVALAFASSRPKVSIPDVEVKDNELRWPNWWIVSL